MADREKVIKGLELCSTYDCNRCDNCPYGRTCGYGCDQTGLLRDALKLLKEQEEGIQNLISDYEDLSKEHERLLDKKIPLITQGLEVVRCKDCKWFMDGYCHDKDCDIPSPDWFCADGERK